MSQDYSHWMQKAICLANLADAKIETNPKVGALLINQHNQIIAEGYHQQFGADHAEVVALSQLTAAPTDRLFVTLEPCCFAGKTQACTDFLIKKQVKKVVVGCKDPNPKVNGKGIQQLKAAGVEVMVGVLEKQCQELNRVYNLHNHLKRPYVAVKAAISLDGKLALKDGSSKWITSEIARNEAQNMRSQYQAIAVGKNTLWQDNPQLNNRGDFKAYQPIRVVFANHAEVAPNSNFFKQKKSRRLVFAGSAAQVKQPELAAAGIDLFCAPNLKTNIPWALQLLYEQNIGSLLVEGGSRLISEFMRAGLVDCLHLFISGKLLGSDALGWCSPLAVLNMPNAPEFHLKDVEKIGDDILIYAEPKNTPCLPE